MEKNTKKKNHFAIHKKLTHHKSTIPQKKKATYLCLLTPSCLRKPIMAKLF